MDGGERGELAMPAFRPIAKAMKPQLVAREEGLLVSYEPGCTSPGRGRFVAGETASASEVSFSAAASSTT